MSKIKYLDYVGLLAAVREGREVGYNRQLDAGAVISLPYDNLFPVGFSMLHEHIAGRKVEPHVRAQVILDAEGNSVWLDMSLERFNGLSVAEV